MPLVFIHGVNNREGSAYQRAKRIRDRLFLTEFLPRLVGRQLTIAPIANPYWGHLGANPRLDGTYQTVPSSPSRVLFGAETAEIDNQEVAAMVAGLSEELSEESQHELLETPLVTVARHNGLPAAVALLSTASLAADHVRKSPHPELDLFLSDALTYAEWHDHPAWLGEVHDDLAFFSRLAAEVSSQLPIGKRQVYGSGDWLTTVWAGVEAVGRQARQLLWDFPRATASQLALHHLRSWMHHGAACGIGDALVYARQRGGSEAAPGPILESVILPALDEAVSKRTDNDPLIVVGHSLGGVIAFDALSCFRKQLSCDVLLTVGSQVGFFQELGILGISPVTPGHKCPKPANIGLWVNVYDPVDVLAFLAGPVFVGVTDLPYSNRTGALSAHTAYFYDQRFHRWLGKATCDASNLGTDTPSHEAGLS